MLRSSLPFVGSLLLACSGSPATIGETPPTPIEKETASTAAPVSSFTGAASGCANLLVVRGNADDTQYLKIRVDRDAFGLEVGSKVTIDLAKASSAVDVTVDVWSSPVSDRYCTDATAPSAAT